MSSNVSDLVNLTDVELIDLALETEDAALRQQALSEHNRRLDVSVNTITVAAGATEQERCAVLDAQLKK